MFLEELCILGLMCVALIGVAIILGIGWIASAEQRKHDKNDMRRITYENCVLRDKLRRIEALKNIDVANEFNAYLDREGGNK